MNIDTLGRVHAQEAHEAVATADMPPIEEIVADRRTRRFAAGIVWTAAAATAVVATFLLVGPGSDVTPTTLPPASDVTTTLPPVSEPFESVLQTDPLVLRAELGPEPAFDTSGFGIEQPFNPVASLDSFGLEMLTTSTQLVVDERMAVGQLVGSGMGVFVASGTIDDPMLAGYGEAGQCIWVSSRPNSGGGECHQVLPGTALRPFATGLLGVNWVGWTFLPEDASVVVLTVEGEDRYWQRPRGGTAFFALEQTPAESVELRVLNADGVEIARGDRRQPNEPTEPTVEPILGYGDFFDVAYDDLDTTEVVGLTVACVNDQGFPVTQSALGDGIVGFGSVPSDQQRAMLFALAGCRAGLNLPEAPYEPFPAGPPPIIGYGDYTDVAYEDVDWHEVTESIVACVRDQRYAVTSTPAGDAISYASVPVDQREAAEYFEGQCRAGLNLPEPPE